MTAFECESNARFVSHHFQMFHAVLLVTQDL